MFLVTGTTAYTSKLAPSTYRLFSCTEPKQKHNKQQNTLVVGQTGYLQMQSSSSNRFQVSGAMIAEGRHHISSSDEEEEDQEQLEPDPDQGMCI